MTAETLHSACPPAALERALAPAVSLLSPSRLAAPGAGAQAAAPATGARAPFSLRRPPASMRLWSWNAVHYSATDGAASGRSNPSLATRRSGLWPAPAFFLADTLQCGVCSCTESPGTLPLGRHRASAGRVAPAPFTAHGRTAACAARHRARARRSDPMFRRGNVRGVVVRFVILSDVSSTEVLN